jgi:hypothetical protein
LDSLIWFILFAFIVLTVLIATAKRASRKQHRQRPEVKDNGAVQ